MLLNLRTIQISSLIICLVVTEMLGTKPQRASLYYRAAGASIPAAEATSITSARYTHTHTHTHNINENCVFMSQFSPPVLLSPILERNTDLQRILTDLAALQSPNSIIRAANVRLTFCETFFLRPVFNEILI